MKSLVNSKVLITLVFLMLIFNHCKKETIVKLDKKITLNLHDNSLGSGSVQKSIVYSTPQTDFRITDYEDIDSISLVLSGIFISGSGTLDVMIVDMKDKNIAIENSKITTKGIADTMFVVSKNILSDFNNKPINIGLKVISSNMAVGDYWILKHASLILVRK